MRFLFLLFIVMPVVEMWLLIAVGAEIGALYTIGLVLLTAVIGVRLLREQGLATLCGADANWRKASCPHRRLVRALFWRSPERYC